jgi:AcrR family transcriptional regulator
MKYRTSARRGRRAGPSRTREQILAAARARFAAHGYEATTMRDVAAAAGVDAALVHYFFGTKPGLFGAAMALPTTPAEVVGELLEEGVDDLGERLVRRFLALWDDPETGAPLLALVRSAASHEEAAAVLRGFLGEEVVGRLARALDAPEPELRATLAGSQLAGLAMVRYVVGLEPLASTDPEWIVATIGPSIQRYLTGPLDVPPT